MPEIIEEEVNPTEKKSGGTVLSVVLACALSSGATFYGTQEIADNAMQEKISNSKYEIVAESEYVERIISTDTLGGLDTIPAGITPIMARFTPDIVTIVQDTFIVSMTKKNNDSILYYGIYTPSAGKSPVLKVNFLDIQ